MVARAAVLLLASLSAALLACGAPAPADTPAESEPSSPQSAPTTPPIARELASPGETASGSVATQRTCAADHDCEARELCVAGVCKQACQFDSQCGGSTCFIDGSQGWCYNAPGCNPPPPGTMCSTSCWGYCE